VADAAAAAAPEDAAAGAVDASAAVAPEVGKFEDDDGAASASFLTLHLLMPLS
jgi:hypothetical protein